MNLSNDSAFYAPLIILQIIGLKLIRPNLIENSGDTIFRSFLFCLPVQIALHNLFVRIFLKYLSDKIAVATICRKRLSYMASNPIT